MPTLSAELAAYVRRVAGPDASARVVQRAIAELEPVAAAGRLDAAAADRVREVALAAVERQQAALGRRLRRLARLRFGCSTVPLLLGRRAAGQTSAPDAPRLYRHLDRCQDCAELAGRFEAAEWQLHSRRAAPGGSAPGSPATPGSRPQSRSIAPSTALRPASPPRTPARPPPGDVARPRTPRSAGVDAAVPLSAAVPVSPPAAPPARLPRSALGSGRPGAAAGSPGSRRGLPGTGHAPVKGRGRVAAAILGIALLGGAAAAAAGVFSPGGRPGGRSGGPITPIIRQDAPAPAAPVRAIPAGPVPAIPAAAARRTRSAPKRPPGSAASNPQHGKRTAGLPAAPAPVAAPAPAPGAHTSPHPGPVRHTAPSVPAPAPRAAPRRSSPPPAPAPAPKPSRGGGTGTGGGSTGGGGSAVSPTFTIPLDSSGTSPPPATPPPPPPGNTPIVVPSQ